MSATSSDIVEKFHYMPMPFTFTARPLFEMDSVIDPEQKLVRFLDLPKLLDLIARRALFLAPLRALLRSDPFECAARYGYEHLTEEEVENGIFELEVYAPEMNQNRMAQMLASVESLMKRAKIMDRRDLLWRLEKEHFKNRIACCCFYAGENESDAMWRIYSNQQGVAVFTSPQRLKETHGSIGITTYVDRENCGPRLKLKKIQYEDRAACAVNDLPWLIKRKAFEHEKEVRLYTQGEHVSQGLHLPVNLEGMIEKIVLSPFLADWAATSLKTTIVSLLTLANQGKPTAIDVSVSEHMSSPPQEGWPLASEVAISQVTEAVQKRIDKSRGMRA